MDTVLGLDHRRDVGGCGISSLGHANADAATPAAAAAQRDLMATILSARELVRAKEEAVEFWEKHVLPFRD